MPKGQLKPRFHSSKTELSALVKEARSRAGLTQEQLASVCGVSLWAIREVEQGREENVKIGTAQDIADYFGKTLSLVDTISVKAGHPGALDRGLVLRKLGAVQALVEEELGISRMVLFGSYARDEATETSDIDVMIFPMKSLSLSALAKLEIRISQVLSGKKVDLVVTSEIRAEVSAKAEKDFIDV